MKNPLALELSEEAKENFLALFSGEPMKLEPLWQWLLRLKTYEGAEFARAYEELAKAILEFGEKKSTERINRGDEQAKVFGILSQLVEEQRQARFETDKERKAEQRRFCVELVVTIVIALIGWGIALGIIQ